MRRTTLASVACIAALAIGCGGDDGADPDEYRADLDGLCAEQQELLLQLPQMQADENLTNEQIGEIANGYADDFREDVESLDPPSDLEEEHEALLALNDEGTQQNLSLEETLASFDRAIAIYEDLGATGCADGIRDSYDRVEESIENVSAEDLGG